ncbi:MAG: sigma-70 family RNA polymerase sigma factor [candidate division Zixibacteria bacterium]|nr:sigma-70 family RNA polymerase sigma factor [candidate division Zixibacteria bacterium]
MTEEHGPAESQEAAVVAQARAGNRRAFAKLHQRFAPMVHGILLARVPRAEVDDLMQDVFLSALKRLDSLREDVAFGPWLATIARNRATDYHRRKRTMDELPEHLPSNDPPRGEAQRVLDVIETLPEAYRETLILRLVEDMTGPEIAERTGLTPGSVRVNLHRGMKLLRERLGIEVST